MNENFMNWDSQYLELFGKRSNKKLNINKACTSKVHAFLVSRFSEKFHLETKQRVITGIHVI